MPKELEPSGEHQELEIANSVAYQLDRIARELQDIKALLRAPLEATVVARQSAGARSSFFPDLFIGPGSLYLASKWARRGPDTFPLNQQPPAST